MYQLARHGYCVQITDSRFPTYDMLVVSPGGKHFGIEVKGQSTPNFWRFNERAPRREMYYAFVFVPPDGEPRVFVMRSTEAMRLWKEYKEKTMKRTGKDSGIWGLNWTQPHRFENQYDRLPK
jgi:hypothetical protein